MEVGASSQAREGGMRALVRSEFLFPSLEFLCGFLLLAIFFLLPLHFSSSLGTGLTEESGCSSRGGPEIRGQSSASGVLWARKDGGGSGRIRDGGFLWASEGSNIMFLHILSPTSPQESLSHTICHHPSSTPSIVPRT